MPANVLSVMVLEESLLEYGGQQVLVKRPVKIQAGENAVHLQPIRL